MDIRKLLFVMFVLTMTVRAEAKSEMSFLDRLKVQTINNDKMREGKAYIFSKLDDDTNETKTFFDSILKGNSFGIIPYRTNFVLPLSWSKSKPSRVYDVNPKNTEAPKTYANNIEVEFQLSLQKELSYNLFGWNEYIFAAYTQKVWWQLYGSFGSFRETNYEPEIFFIFPTSQSIDDEIGLKSVKVGFVHESNGREGYRSRSWNRIYATGLWQWDNLFLATRAWYRLDEDKKSDSFYLGEIDDPYSVIAQSEGDDNPDIEDYLGYGDIRLQYFYKKSKFGLLIRNNLDFSDNKGALELNYAYPIFDSSSSFFYVKLFKGYGASLIEYNENVTRASFGVSFSNELF